MDDDKAVTANFERATCYTLMNGVDPAASGSVSASPVPNCGIGKYVAGTQVKLTASSGAGFAFDRWSGDVAASANPETVLVAGDKLVTAHLVWPNQIYLPFALRNGH